jgi:hypothetical protein
MALFLWNCWISEQHQHGLQSKWAILTVPAHFWSPNNMVAIMKTCVILQNMIVGDNKQNSNEPYQLPPNMTLLPP